jgi:hypothetical protein
MEQAVHLAVVAAIRLSRLEAEMEGEYKCMWLALELIN